MNASSIGNSIDYMLRVIQQKALQNTGGNSFGRLNGKAEILRQSAYIGRCALHQNAPPVHDKNIGAHFCFVHVGGVNKNGNRVACHKTFENFPKLTPRKRIYSDSRLVQKQQRRGANQRTGKPELLLHAA